MTTTTESAPGLTDAQASRLIPGAAIAVVGGPLLLAIANAVVNFGPVWKDVDDTADLLAAVAAHPTATEADMLLGLASVALLPPAAWAIMLMLRRRSPLLAAVGGWLTAVGYAFALVLTTESAVPLQVAKAGIDPAPLAEAIDGYTPLPMMIVYAVFGVGALLGCVFLGVAALRQGGLVPRWAGWALIASAPVRIAGLAAGIAAGPPLASLLILAGFIGILISFRRSGAPATA